jgi:tetratricopeptide (TPR) repeat protein
LFSSGRLQEAADLVERAVEANGDDYYTYVPFLNALGAIGDKEGQRKLRGREMKVLENQLELVPEDMRARILLAVDYAELGRPEDAIRELKKAVALRPNDGNTLYNAACVYGVLGRKSESLEMLRRAKDAGYHNLDWASRDPDLALLYDEPEFHRILDSPGGG